MRCVYFRLSARPSWASLWPVSYTHLDVYKRQPKDPAALQELAALKEKNASMPELVQFCCTHGTGLRKTHHIHGILGNEAMQRAAGDNVLHHGERLTPPVAVGDWDGLQAAQQLTDCLLYTSLHLLEILPWSISP